MRTSRISTTSGPAESPEWASAGRGRSSHLRVTTVTPAASVFAGGSLCWRLVLSLGRKVKGMFQREGSDDP